MPPHSVAQLALLLGALMPLGSGWAGSETQTAAAAPQTREAMVAEIEHTAAEDYPGLPDDPSFKRAVEAIAHIDRAAFVPLDQRARAYQDTPLQIGFGQTISDPYIVAVMTAATGAGPGSNVFEVGTGSGYQAAVLSRVGATVHSVEIVPQLARAAKARLHRMGFPRVSVRAGDGFAGWPAFAPYDDIIVTAGAAAIPLPLLAQLRPGGRLVMPIGANTSVEQLLLVTKRGDGTLETCSLGPAMFVPLTGRGQQPEIHAVFDRSIKLCRKGQTARWPGQPVG